MMATNAPFGFKPLRHPSGVFREESFPIASAYATSIFSGDPVKLISDGSIQLAAAGERVLGVFNGVQYYGADGSPIWSPYWIASAALQTGTIAVAFVYADPEIIFAVQSAGTPAQTNIGNLADHVAGTGNPSSGRSAVSLSGTMAATDAGFRIIKIPQELPNNTGIYSIVQVKIFEHEFSRDRPATPGV